MFIVNKINWMSVMHTPCSFINNNATILCTCSLLLLGFDWIASSFAMIIWVLICISYVFELWVQMSIGENNTNRALTGQDVENLYDILGVESTASLQEIKKGYRKTVMKWHPDRSNGDVDLFNNATTAYKILSDTKLRQQYDKGRGSSSNE